MEVVTGLSKVSDGGCEGCEGVSKVKVVMG